MNKQERLAASKQQSYRQIINACMSGAAAARRAEDDRLYEMFYQIKHLADAVYDNLM